jgi:hypothetical protein
VGVRVVSRGVGVEDSASTTIAIGYEERHEFGGEWGDEILWTMETSIVRIKCKPFSVFLSSFVGLAWTGWRSLYCALKISPCNYFQLGLKLCYLSQLFLQTHSKKKKKQFSFILFSFLLFFQFLMKNKKKYMFIS